MKKKKSLALVLVVLMMLAAAACSDSSDDDEQDLATAQPSAPVSVDRGRLIRINAIEGANATRIRDGNETSVRRLQNLYVGDTSLTGAATHKYLNLNSQTILKMDENTSVSIDKASEKGLSMTLLEGAVSTDLTRASPSDTYEFSAGSATLIIRGTTFIVEYRGETPLFIMLAGSGNFGRNKPFEAGHMATVADDEVIIEPLAIRNNFSRFVLREIIARAEMLIENGTLTQKDIHDAQRVLAGETIPELDPDHDPEEDQDNGGDS